MAAVQYAHKEIVDMLLKAGANPNIRANNGVTALTLAENKGHKEIADMLRAASKNYK
jgi:ankyrin repeat protein